jgi:hypothetical protein
MFITSHCYYCYTTHSHLVVILDAHTESVDQYGAKNGPLIMLGSDERLYQIPQPVHVTCTRVIKAEKTCTG